MVGIDIIVRYRKWNVDFYRDLLRIEIVPAIAKRQQNVALQIPILSIFEIFCIFGQLFGQFFGKFEHNEKGPRHVNPTCLCRVVSLPPPHPSTGHYFVALPAYPPLYPQRDISLSRCQQNKEISHCDFFVTLKNRFTPLKEMLPCLFDKETNFRVGGQRKISLSPWQSNKNSSLRHYFVTLSKRQKIAPCA